MKHVAEAFFPTRFGNFRIHAFTDEEKKEHIVLYRCLHERHDSIPVRIHSKCLTGDSLTSLRCDCRAQLETALEYLEKNECGMLIYLDHEGRGIGLANKIKAYSLQDNGMDTVEANEELGFCGDLRDYSVAAEILKYFKIQAIKLMTNNPEKIKQVEKHGIKVVERIPIVAPATRYNGKYLKTKKEKMDHFL